MSIILSNQPQGKDICGIGLVNGANNILVDNNMVNAASIVLSANTGSFATNTTANTWYLIHDGAGTPTYHGIQLQLSKRSTIVWNASIGINFAGTGMLCRVRLNIKTGSLATGTSLWSGQETRYTNFNSQWQQMTNNGIKTLDPGTYYFTFEWCSDQAIATGIASGYWNTNVLVFPGVV